MVRKANGKWPRPGEPYFGWHADEFFEPVPEGSPGAEDYRIFLRTFGGIGYNLFQWNIGQMVGHDMLHFFKPEVRYVG